MKLLTIGLIVATLVTVITLALTEAQQLPQVPALAGIYRAVGKNPDGSQYENCAQIFKIKNTYRVLWTMENDRIIGVAIWSNGIFAVSYFGNTPAIAVYKLDGKNLVGEWTMGGAEGATYAETLTRVDKCELPIAPPATPSPSRPSQPGQQVDVIKL